MPGQTKLVFFLLSLGILYWPGIQRHWETIQNPYYVPYDAVQYIPSFFKYDPRDPIPTTYIKEYYLNAVCPPLYKWLTELGARFSDVRQFQFGMMYLQYAVFISVLGRLGWVLGGATLSFAVAALTITAWIFLGLGFIGGAPRMYAYPLMALVLYSLIRDHPKLLAVTVVLGSLFYPIVATIGGLCLASWLLLPPLSRRGVVSSWRLSHRLIAVALAGFLAIAALIPLMLGGAIYGRRVVESDIATYPEAGPDGNYRIYDKLPYKLFGTESITYLIGPMYSHGDPIAPWVNAHKQLDPVALLFVLGLTGLIILVVIVHGIKLLLKDDSRGAGQRLISFYVVCTLTHVIAWLVAPYLYIPTRYFMFSLPFLTTLIFPWSLYMLLNRAPRLWSSPTLRNVLFLGMVSIYLMAFGGRGNVEFSVSPVQNSSPLLYEAIAALPTDVVIAGWPVGEIQKIEYLTRRNIFLSGHLHQVLHLSYMQVMRKRMDALFEAYVSTDAEPLHRLREEFGVTHLLVETRDFTDPDRPPEYFAPWRERIRLRLAEIKGREYLLNASLQMQTAIYNQNGILLIDLAKLP